jgi:hypothetical protein
VWRLRSGRTRARFQPFSGLVVLSLFEQLFGGALIDFGFQDDIAEIGGAIGGLVESAGTQQLFNFRPGGIGGYVSPVWGEVFRAQLQLVRMPEERQEQVFGGDRWVVGLRFVRESSCLVEAAESREQADSGNESRQHCLGTLRLPRQRECLLIVRQVPESACEAVALPLVARYRPPSAGRVQLRGDTRIRRLERKGLTATDNLPFFVLADRKERR